MWSSHVLLGSLDETETRQWSLEWTSDVHVWVKGWTDVCVNERVNGWILYISYDWVNGCTSLSNMTWNVHDMSVKGSTHVCIYQYDLRITGWMVARLHESYEKMNGFMFLYDTWVRGWIVVSIQCMNDRVNLCMSLRNAWMRGWIVFPLSATSCPMPPRDPDRRKSVIDDEWMSDFPQSREHKLS